MDIQINCQRELPGLKKRTIEGKAAKVLSALACRDKELSILLTDDAAIARLNRHYLGREGSTNVLAFPMSGGPPPEVDSGMLGDVVISVDTAIRESAAGGEPVARTVDRLLIHGILHLLGYDHEGSVADAEKMAEKETTLLSLIEEE